MVLFPSTTTKTTTKETTATTATTTTTTTTATTTTTTTTTTSVTCVVCGRPTDTATTADVAAAPAQPGVCLCQVCEQAMSMDDDKDDDCKVEDIPVDDDHDDQYQHHNSFSLHQPSQSQSTYDDTTASLTMTMAATVAPLVSPSPIRHKALPHNHDIIATSTDATHTQSYPVGVSFVRTTCIVCGSMLSSGTTEGFCIECQQSMLDDSELTPTTTTEIIAATSTTPPSIQETATSAAPAAAFAGIKRKLDFDAYDEQQHNEGDARNTVHYRRTDGSDPAPQTTTAATTSTAIHVMTDETNDVKDTAEAHHETLTTRTPIEASSPSYVTLQILPDDRERSHGNIGMDFGTWLQESMSSSSSSHDRTNVHVYLSLLNNINNDDNETAAAPCKWYGRARVVQVADHPPPPPPQLQAGPVLDAALKEESSITTTTMPAPTTTGTCIECQAPTPEPWMSRCKNCYRNNEKDKDTTSRECRVCGTVTGAAWKQYCTSCYIVTTKRDHALVSSSPSPSLQLSVQFSSSSSSSLHSPSNTHMSSRRCQRCNKFTPESWMKMCHACFRQDRNHR